MQYASSALIIFSTRRENLRGKNDQFDVQCILVNLAVHSNSPYSEFLRCSDDPARNFTSETDE